MIKNYPLPNWKYNIYWIGLNRCIIFCYNNNNSVNSINNRKIRFYLKKAHVVTKITLLIPIEIAITDASNIYVNILCVNYTAFWTSFFIKTQHTHRRPITSKKRTLKLMCITSKVV